MKKKSSLIILALILAIGLSLRLYHIESAPPGIYPDEAVNGIDAIENSFQWYYPANNGREGLFMNLIAILFRTIGVSVLALKLPAIVFSTLSILGTYLLSKELFRKERPALVAAFLVAFSFWSINFGRISFRANLLPFALSFLFFFILKGLRTERFRDWAWAGFFCGLGFHTYIAYKIAPAILLAWLPFVILSREDFWKRYWKRLFIFSAVALAVFAPMAFTYYQHPEYLESRSSVSIFAPEYNHGSVVRAFFRSLSLSLVKYNFWGDQNWRHNYAPYPILDPASGALFLFGAILAIIRFFRLGAERIRHKLRDTDWEKYALLLLWFFGMLAPEFMTAEGLPHALRSIGTLPAVFILAAFGLEYLWNRTGDFRPITQQTTSLLIVLILVFISIFNPVKYFCFWGQKKVVAQSFNRVDMDISNYVRTLPPATEKFIVIGPMDRIPIRVFNHDLPNTSYLYPEEIDRISPRTDDFQIIFSDQNDEAVMKLIKRLGELQTLRITDRFGISFFLLTK